jgi:hypothetical protein
MEWNIQTGLCENTFVDDDVVIQSLSLLPSGNVACMTHLGILQVWDMELGTCTSRNLNLEKDAIYYAVRQLKSGDICISTHRGLVSVWNWRTDVNSKLFQSPHINEHTVNLLMLQDGRLCLSSSSNVYIYNLDSGDCEQVFEGGSSFIAQLSDGRICIAGSTTISIWS